LVKKRE